MKRSYSVLAFAAFVLGCCTYNFYEAPVFAAATLDDPGDGELENGHAGFFLGSPLGITASGADSLIIRTAGWKLPPDPDGAPPSPRPDFEGLPAHLRGGVTASNPILAMSLGTDVIPFTLHDSLSADEYLEPNLANTQFAEIHPMTGLGGWMAFEFSVNSSETYLGGGGHLLAPDIVDAGADVGRTVFSYLLPGDMPTLEVEEQSVSAFGPDELPLGADQEIEGLSMHMALYQTDMLTFAGAFTTRPLAPDPWVYFTLRPGFLADLASAGATLPWITHSDSGTIYRVHWDDANQAWGVPEKFRAWAELVESPGRQVPAIDGLALSMDLTTGTGVLLFSTDAATAVEDQVRFVHIGSGPDRPRRVVVRKKNGPGTYGSLGVQLGAGAALGDLCNKDPAVDTQTWSLPSHPDEYFVARRAWPIGSYTELRRPSLALLSSVPVFVPMAKSRVEGPLPFPVPDPMPGPRPSPWPDFDRFHWWREDFRWQHGVPIRVVPVLRDPVPVLDLAVSGYRQQLKAQGGNGVPHMRTCMSWPRPLASSGSVTVRWGTVGHFLYPYNVDWNALPDTTGLIYTGAPMSDEMPLPVSTIDGSQTRAVVAQWVLQTPTKTYVSHLSVLRY